MEIPNNPQSQLRPLHDLLIQSVRVISVSEYERPLHESVITVNCKEDAAPAKHQDGQYWQAGQEYVVAHEERRNQRCQKAENQRKCPDDYKQTEWHLSGRVQSLWIIKIQVVHAEHAKKCHNCNFDESIFIIQNSVVPWAKLQNRRQDKRANDKDYLAEDEDKSACWEIKCESSSHDLSLCFCRSVIFGVVAVLF